MSRVATASRTIGRGVALPERARQPPIVVPRGSPSVGLFVIDPVDDRTAAVTVHLDHRIDVRPDRDRGCAAEPLQSNGPIGEGRSLGNDADTTHARRILIAHQYEAPRHRVVSGAKTPPGSVPTSMCPCTFSAGIPVYPLSVCSPATFCGGWSSQHEPGRSAMSSSPVHGIYACDA